MFKGLYRRFFPKPTPEQVREKARRRYSFLFSETFDCFFDNKLHLEKQLADVKARRKEFIRLPLGPFGETTQGELRKREAKEERSCRLRKYEDKIRDLEHNLSWLWVKFGDLERGKIATEGHELSRRNQFVDEGGYSFENWYQDIAIIFYREDFWQVYFGRDRKSVMQARRISIDKSRKHLTDRELRAVIHFQSGQVKV